jgi:hypothetical protein
LSILKTTDVNQRPSLMIFLESFQTSREIVMFENSALSLKATNEIAPAEHPDDPREGESVPERDEQSTVLCVPFRDGLIVCGQRRDAPDAITFVAFSDFYVCPLRGLFRVFKMDKVEFRFC